LLLSIYRKAVVMPMTDRMRTEVVPGAGCRHIHVAA